jgi:hypothetical protein
MASPRPPVIISNGSVLEEFKNRLIDSLKLDYEPSHKVVTDILYGNSTKNNGVATIVTLKDGSQFVYWKKDGESDFTNKKDKSMYDKKYRDIQKEDKLKK